MKFQAAYTYLLAGHKITLPEWQGYWVWDYEAEMIMMHCKNGDVVRFVDTHDLPFTMSFLFRDDWIKFK